MPRRRTIKVNIPKRIEKWKSENLLSKFKLTEKMEASTSNLFGLLELLIPNSMVSEACKKALQISKNVLDKQEIAVLLGVENFEKIHGLKIEACDQAAKILLSKAVLDIEKLEFDSASPLKLAPSLLELFNSTFITIGKIGLCFGFDVLSLEEHSKMLTIFSAGISLELNDKKNALQDYGKLEPVLDQEMDQKIMGMVSLTSKAISKRRALAAVPTIQAAVGNSSAAWILKDVGEAAMNMYAERLLIRSKVTELQEKPATQVVDLVKPAPLPKAA